MLVDMEVSDIIRSNGMKKITATTWWLNKYYFNEFMTRETTISEKPILNCEK